MTTIPIPIRRSVKRSVEDLIRALVLLFFMCAFFGTCAVIDYAASDKQSEIP